MTARVVVIDDEPNMGVVLTKLLRLEGHAVTAFDSAENALTHVAKRGAEVVITDLRMPEMTGEEVLERLRAAGFRGAVIVMTAYGSIESAMRCVKNGAFDYVTKPFDTKALLATVRRAAQSAPVADRAPTPRAKAPDNELLGESPEMRSVREMIARIAPSESSVLIYGESGTGKELAARAIHRQSARSKGRFIAINCASIPESLIESELFGHEKGSFTGAHEAKTGLVEAASGGTLFLDEIGELPVAMQAKLLRVLQEREISRVGSVHSMPVDIRVIAATNRRLETAVQTGEFREDLYYRLNVIKLKMPPLRERLDDIPIIAEHIIGILRERGGRPRLALHPSFLVKLKRLQWPGNVRELRNFIERVAVLSDSDMITEDVLLELAVFDSQLTPQPAAGHSPTSPGASHHPPGQALDYREARERFEVDYIHGVLKSCVGNVTEAARKAGMSRRNFYDKLEKLGIDPSLFK